MSASAYAGQLTAIKPRSVKKGRSSKASKKSRAESRASSAAKLQVRIEEAEAKVEEDFNRDATERAQRVANRDAKRKQERLAQEAKEEAGRLEDEAAEREAATKKKLALAQAKKAAIESHDEENSIRTTSEPEITPIEKAAAFVGELFKCEFASNFEQDPKSENQGAAAAHSKIKNIVPDIYSTEKFKHFKSGAKGENCDFKTEYSVAPPAVLKPFDNPPIYTAPTINSQYAWPTHSNQFPPPCSTKKEHKAPVTTEHFEISTPVTKTKTDFPGAGQEHSGIRRSPTNPYHEHFSNLADSSNADRVIEAVCGQLALSRLPVSEPEIFSGKDPLAFPIWRMTFDAMVRHRAMTPLDKLSLLNRYLDGEAKEAIRGYLLMPPSEAYDEAYGLLLDRYGDSVRVANAFKDRMRAWTKVGGTDARGLRIFVDFLKQCRTAKRSFPTLKVLDDEAENVEMIKKLPGWLARKWTRKISNHRGATGEFPSFSFFVDFLVEEEKGSQ